MRPFIGLILTAVLIACVGTATANAAKLSGCKTSALFKSPNGKFKGSITVCRKNGKVTSVKPASGSKVDFGWHLFPDTHVRAQIAPKSQGGTPYMVTIIQLPNGKFHREG